MEYSHPSSFYVGVISTRKTSIDYCFWSLSCGGGESLVGRIFIRETKLVEGRRRKQDWPERGTELQCSFGSPLGRLWS